MKRGIILLALILSFHFGFSSSPLTGPTTGTVGSSSTYVFNNSTVYPTFSWNITNGLGTVTSSTLVGTTYTAVILWSTPGTGTVSYVSGATNFSINVTISCVSVPTPNATFTYPNGTTACGSLNINYAASPPTGVKWYWQTTATGTSTLTITQSYQVNSSGTYYLRANCGSTWSTALASSAVTVKTIPSVGAMSPTICSGTQVDIPLTNNIASTTNTWTTVSTNASGAANSSGVSGSTSPFVFHLLQTLSATSNVAGTVVYSVIPSLNGCTGATQHITVTINPIPTAAASPSSQTVCSGSSATTITLSNPNNVTGTTYSWAATTSNATVSVPTGTGSTISSSLTSADGTNAGTATYTITPATASCTGAPITATLTTNVITAPPAAGLYLFYGTYGVANLQITVPQGKQAGWYLAKFGQTPPFFTGSIYQTSFTSDDPQMYYVSLKDLTTLCESVRVPVTGTWVSKITPASVTKEVIRVTNKHSDGDINALNNTSDKAVTVAYMDGLSRACQIVAIKASPGQKDIIQPIEYDAFGRNSKNYLPYTKSNTSGFQGSYVTDQPAFYLASNDKIANDSYPFSIANYETSTLGRPLEIGNTGAAWQPTTGHTKRVTYTYNTGASANDDNVEEVRKFNSAGTSSRFYAANTLSKVIVTDENGHLDYVFKNATGKTVVRKQQLDTTINGTMVHYLQTYYVYDTLNRLTYIIPPAGQAALKSAGWILNPTMIDQHFHQFVYDNRGRLTQKKTPGQAWTYYGYDKLNRLVLTQDGNLRPLNKWAFVKYDQMGRPVMSGLYKNTTQTDISTVQPILDGLYGGTNPFYEIRATTLYGYSNQSFPTANADAGTTALEILSVNYYDNYDFDFDVNHTADYTYDNAHISGLPTTAGPYIRTLPTGNWKLILGTTNWLKTAVFYDKYGRVIQTQSNNHLNLTVADKASVLYDFEGKVVKTKNYHNPGANPVTTCLTPQYDSFGRKTGIYDSIAGPTPQLLAQYQYNELGQVVMKQLHNTGGSNFLQNVDYRYNIRGWLSSINNAALNADNNLTNNDTNDYFGMELFYNDIESGGLNNSKQYFNGNVSAVKWKGMGDGSGTAGQRSYKFTYDKTDKLLAANFQKYGTSTWNLEQNTQDETMMYDHNGNTLTLQRNQNQRGFQLNGGVPTITAAAQAMDNLTYTYASPNQLSKVTDASGNTAGFNDGINATTEYTYDTQGSMIVDQNKGITGIIYNVLGKPSQITVTAGGVTKVINYTYDASGTKLKMATTVSGTTTTTDYVNGFVYTNSTLSFFSSPEGRVIKNGTNFEYQYAIADHQGNTRILFTSATPTPVATIATFEGDSNDKSGQFSNVTNVQTYAAANHTPAGSKAVKMTSSNPVGPSISKSVFAGDKIDLSVYSYYESSSGYGGTNVSVASMITAVAGAFGGVPNAPDVTGQIYSGVNNSLSVLGIGTNLGDGQPSAYLNYILFDRNFKVMDAGWLPAPAGAFAQHPITFPTVTAKEAGYIFVYLSYDGQGSSSIYFDDLNVTITPTNVIQSNEYYPFGLQTANSWTRDNTTNNFLYDAGSEMNTTSGFYDLPFRNYDVALGRFFQVDPLAHRDHDLTPYHYAGNNPIGSNDPSGLMQQYYEHPEDDPRNWRMNVGNLNPQLDYDGHWGDDYLNDYGNGGYYGGSGMTGGISSKVPGDYTTYSQQDLREEARNGNPDVAPFINDPRGPMVAQYDENGNLELVSARQILGCNCGPQNQKWIDAALNAMAIWRERGGQGAWLANQGPDPGRYAGFNVPGVPFYAYSTDGSGNVYQTSLHTYTKNKDGSFTKTANQGVNNFGFTMTPFWETDMGIDISKGLKSAGEFLYDAAKIYMDNSDPGPGGLNDSLPSDPDGIQQFQK